MKTNILAASLAFLTGTYFQVPIFLSPLHGQVDHNVSFPWEKDLPESINELIEIQSQIQKQFLEVQHSVVSIEAEDGAGSGVIVSSDGYILTAAHVIGERGKKMKVIFSNGEQTDAVSLGGSELSDAGLLKITEQGERQYAEMAEARSSEVGDWCFALGHPSGFDMERGMVLRVGRIIRKKAETIQTDCRLLGGDSGGPLFSMTGQIIGINSRISGSPEDNFHTSIESFISNWEYFLHEELHTLGSMYGGGFLGVLCEESAKGLKIIEVVDDTPAMEAGIQIGDILTQIDGANLDTKEKLTILVSSKEPGTHVVIDYLREDKEISARIKLGERASVK